MKNKYLTIATVCVATALLYGAGLQTGLLDKSIVAIQTTLKIRSNQAQAYHNLGNIYAEKGWYNYALRAYQQVLLTNQNNISTRTNIVQIYLLKGDKVKAEAEYQKVQELLGKR